MRAPVMYLVCAAALLVSARSTPIDRDTDSNDADTGLRMAPQGPGSDSDNFAYLLPRLATRYRPTEQWNTITDQDFYMDANGLSEQEPEERYKRAGNGPSLSIINPINVLRDRLLYEMRRRHMAESQKQVAENRKLMKSIGKRGRFFRQPQDMRRPNPLPLDFDVNM